jgi:hypothetical protein
LTRIGVTHGRTHTKVGHKNDNIQKQSKTHLCVELAVAITVELAGVKVVELRDDAIAIYVERMVRNKLFSATLL